MALQSSKLNVGDKHSEVVVEDLKADTRWPDYRPIAVDAGYRAVAAIPLRAADAYAAIVALDRSHQELAKSPVIRV